MASHRSIDSKREEFRKYLENAGLTDAFVRILTMIYESGQQIPDPLQYTREKFERSNPSTVELQHLQMYLDSARERIAVLEVENTQLKEELGNYKSKYPSPCTHPSGN